MRAHKISSTTIELEFDSPEQREQIAKLVSYDIPGAKFMPQFQAELIDGTKCFLTPKNRMKLGTFKSLFPEHSLVYNKEFKDITFDDIRLYCKNPEIERRQYQLNAINTILKNKIGLCCAVMSSGKTLIAAATCSYHISQKPTNKVLFVVYDRNILSQTMSNFKKYGLNISQFGDSIKDLTGDIVVATIQSLQRIEKPREVLKNISMAIVDESHHGKSKSSSDIITKLPNCEYFIGLTATPYRERTLEAAKLTAILGPIIYEYGFQDSVEAGNIVPVKAFFIDLPPDLDIKEEVFTRKNYKIIWDTAIQYNQTRNNQIGHILNTITNILNTTQIVLVDRTEHGIALNNELKKFEHIKSEVSFGEDSLLLRAIKRENLSDNIDMGINTLVSTILKEGVDMNVSPIIAVNASGRKNFISLIQFMGRIFRKNDKFGTFRAYIDFIDRYHPMLYKHSLERIKACEDFGIEIVVCKSIQELLKEIIIYYKECNK